MDEGEAHAVHKPERMYMKELFAHYHFLIFKFILL